MSLIIGNKSVLIRFIYLNIRSDCCFCLDISSYLYISFALMTFYVIDSLSLLEINFTEIMPLNKFDQRIT